MVLVNRRWAVGGIVLWLAGCASGSGQRQPDSGVRTASRCEVEAYPEALPSPDLLVDTAGLNADLHELMEAVDSGSVAERQIVMTLAYQPDGLNMRRDVLMHDTEPFIADSVQKLVFARRLELPESPEEWGVRLRIGLDGGVSYRVERREYCPPRPRDPEIESAMRTYVGSGPRYRGGVRVRTVVVRATIHPAGYVENGTIIRGGVIGSSFEQRLIDYLRQFSFAPATIDGAPAYGDIDIPVQVRG